MGVFRRERGAPLHPIKSPADNPLLGANAPHVFLSHSSKDDQIVSRIAQDLNTLSVDVWLDSWELRVGDDLHERIADAIAKSKFVAVAVSSRFDESKWIKGEVSQALSREKAEARTLVLPLLIENVPLPAVLANKKFLDFTDYFRSLVRWRVSFMNWTRRRSKQDYLKYSPLVSMAASKCFDSRASNHMSSLTGRL
jgi:hypothetical protein